MRSFTFRLTLRFALLVTATTSAVLLAGGWLLDRQVERGLELLHEVEARELAELLGPDGGLSPAEVEARIKHDADSDSALFLIQVATAEGRVVFRSDNLGETILPENGEPARHWTERLPYLGRAHLSQLHHGPWRIVVGSPLEPSERLVRDYLRVSLLLIGGVALAGVALGYAFSRDTLQPLRAIETTARRIRADNLGERIPVPPGKDELASLTRLLNETFDRLQASFEQVRRFTGDVSHELKTPLALIRLNAEKLRPQVAADPGASAAVEDILEEIAQLNQVIERLLFLARTESGVLAPALRPVALAELLAGFAEDAQALAEDRGVRFVLRENRPGEVAAEPELLRQLLLNLVTNAVGVSPPGGEVRLDSAPTGEAWSLAVSDEGPGLPPEQLGRIFGRFVRFRGGDGAEATHGHGLGLAICKAIAELHGGSIRAENRADRNGLRVTVTLPPRAD